jgi:prepilin-type N-terminal cleavage/methylation domain-containing protein/prepilin-type processing-associated H-X9-DG protein
MSRPFRPSTNWNRRLGFTLVELLVVIGIIAVLISVLLPALRRARDAAQRVQCLSNMRQISNAMISFANDHHGSMPSAATTTVLVIDPITGAFKQLPSDKDPSRTACSDWIAWQRVSDPWAQAPYNVNTCAYLNITYSALARYLGSRLIEIDPNSPTAPQDDLKANPALDAIFRCPADDYTARPSRTDTSHGGYRYSYAMNVAWASPKSGALPFAFANFPAKSAGAPRFDCIFNGRISSIRDPSNKVLLICEDFKTLDDGSFKPDANNWSNNTTIIDLLSSRHDTRVRKASNRGFAPNGGVVQEGNEDCLGNVAFCDGHGAFFSRKDALRARYSGNPNLDPAGF